MAWLMLGWDIGVGVLTGVELVECTEAPELISTAKKTLECKCSALVTQVQLCYQVRDNEM